MNTAITTASKSEKKSLMRFYKQQRYSAGLLGFDSTYIIKNSSEIIGAVIISALTENNPQLFLHALVIKQEFRQKKLASQLIQHALHQHDNQQVICFADESLTHFYQNNGFYQITEQQLLQPLLMRYSRYRHSLLSMPPCHHVIPFILNIVVHCHPWHHDIPFILNIKKPITCYWFLAELFNKTCKLSVHSRRFNRIFQ
jgi:N-acetylglutamate synthase-like GNAT family acetyltransferase